MKVNSIKMLNFLLNLYKIKEGTIDDILEIGESVKSKGRVYQIKNDLIKENIISRKKVILNSNKKKLVTIWKINHSKLDDFLITKTKIFFLYERFWNADIVTLRKKKYVGE